MFTDDITCRRMYTYHVSPPEVKKTLWDYSIIWWCHQEEGAGLSKLTSSFWKDVLKHSCYYLIKRQTNTLWVRCTCGNQMYKLWAQIIKHHGNFHLNPSSCCLVQISFEILHSFLLGVWHARALDRIFVFSAVESTDCRQWSQLKVGLALSRSSSPDYS